MTAARLSVSNLSWSPKRTPLLHPTSFDLAPGRVLGVVGPNGAGKTTLLRLLYRFHKPLTGTVCIDGHDIWALPAKSAAQRVAAVLQEHPSDFALTVADIVALGRTPHRRGFVGNTGARDRQIIDQAIDRLDLNGLTHRHLGTLSGGERQRVMVARALAQDPQLLILDEPTNHLDIRHQLEVLDLIRTLPLTIVTSLHDLNLAADVCDDILILQDGRTIGFGAPDAVLTEAAVSNTFHVTARREHLSRSDTTHLTFHL
ncbi:ABC transporter ATP-binding protein [Pseudooctadecabacter jejudonensis]|uniref:Iron(3+)-hydroxamate import ATP-binding protein FhuC n=1 Tax=Pseudooctadecabacter jejudonensis TaxID=1391910 RepID=A0A1Y5SUB5_9RHOB|nr:ABC transporter ATP-binding protein [Pseudooctadecabacter jejudonensis]SLN48540.1 Iron(3+)-hydroxamate import ATP-binding protein FhuC [Pseudooctadecabacter jejudonensis]